MFSCIVVRFCICMRCVCQNDQEGPDAANPEGVDAEEALEEAGDSRRQGGSVRSCGWTRKRATFAVRYGMVCAFEKERHGTVYMDAMSEALMKNYDQIYQEIYSIFIPRQTASSPRLTCLD